MSELKSEIQVVFSVQGADKSALEVGHVATALDGASAAAQLSAEKFSAAFERQHAAAQQIARDSSEYVRFWTEALHRADSAQAEVAASASFERQHAAAAQLVKDSEYVRFWTEALHRADVAQADFAAAASFERQHAAATQLAKDSEYVRFWTDELKKADAAEQQVARQNGFVEGLERQASAIGKSRADLMELQAAKLGVTDRAAPFIAKLREEEAGMLNAGMSAREMAFAMRMIPAQFTDIAVSLAGGQNPMMVMLQQGGQLKDQFGGAGEAAKAMASYVVGLVNPLSVAAVTAGAFALAAYQGAEESRGLAKNITLTGNAAGTSVSQLNALAASVASAAGGTQGLAAGALGDLVKTAQVSSASLLVVADSAVSMERAGVASIENTVKQFAELGKSPVKASLELNESTNYLTASMFAQIKALEDQGKSSEAAELAQQAYAVAMKARAEEIKGSLGTLQKAWLGLGDVAKGAWDMMLGVGRDDDVNKQIQQALATVQGKGYLEGGLLFGDKEYAMNLLAVLDAKLVKERQVGEEKKKQSETEKARTAWLADEDKYLSKKERLAREIAKIEQEGLAAGSSRIEIDRRIAHEKDKYKDREALSSAKREAEQLAALMDKIRGKETGLEASYWQDLERLNKAYRAGKVSLEDYQFMVSKLTTQQPFYVKQLKEQEEAQKKAAEFAKEHAAYLGKLADEETKRAASLVTGNGKLSEEIALLGLNAREQADYRAEKLRSQAATDLHAAALADEQALLEEASGVCTAASAAYRDLAIAKRAAAEAGYEQARLTQEKAYRSEALREEVDFWKSIEGTGRQTFISLTDSGKDAWTRLKHTGQNIFFDWLWQMSAKRWLFNFAVETSGQSAAQQAFGMSGGGTAGALNLAGSANNLLSSLNGSPFASGFSKLAATSWGQSALYTPAQGIQSGGMTLDVLDAGSVGQLSELGGTLKAGAEFLDSYGGYINAAYQLSQGRYGASAGAAIGTYFGGPIGSVIGSFAGGMLDSAFGSNGAPKSALGGGGRITASGVDYNVAGLPHWTDYTAQSQQLASSIVTDQLVTALHKINAGYTGAAYLKGEINSKGSSSNQVLAQATNAAGQVVYHRFVEDGKGAEDFQRAAAAEIPKLQLALMVDAMRGAGGEIKHIADSVVGTTGDLTAALSGMDSAAVAATTANLSGLMDALDRIKHSVDSSITSDAVARIAGFSGGVGNLAAQVASYENNYLSAAERAARQHDEMAAVFARLNLQMPGSKAGFRNLAESLDKTHESGQKAFAAMMGMESAFAAWADTVEGKTRTLADAQDALRQAYDKQSTEMQATVDKFGGYAKSMRDFRASLLTGSLSPLDARGRYAEAKNQFDSVRTRAALGDTAAIESLQNASSAFLEASRAMFASGDAYAADFASVIGAVEGTESLASRQARVAESQLATLKDQVSALVTINESVLSVKDALSQVTLASLQESARGAVSGSTLSGMYRDILGRDADAGGLAYWTQQSQTMTGGELMRAFLGASTQPGNSDSTSAVAWARKMGIPGYASGGIASGTFLAGEFGEELLNTASGSFVAGASGGPEIIHSPVPVRVLPHAVTRGYFGGGQADASPEWLAELKALRLEVAALRKEQAKQTGDLIGAGFAAQGQVADKLADALRDGRREPARMSA